MKEVSNERGALPIVVALIVVALLAVAGFAVHASTQAKKINDAKAQPSASATPTPTPNPTANWTKYNSSTGKFSLQYTPSWKAYTYAGDALTTCQKDRKDNEVFSATFT